MTEFVTFKNCRVINTVTITEEEFSRLEERASLAEAALRLYGQHDQGCPVIVTEDLCTCGLTAVRRAIAEAAAPGPAP